MLGVCGGKPGVAGSGGVELVEVELEELLEKALEELEELPDDVLELDEDDGEDCADVLDDEEFVGGGDVGGGADELDVFVPAVELDVPGVALPGAVELLEPLDGGEVEVVLEAVVDGLPSGVGAMPPVEVVLAPPLRVPSDSESEVESGAVQPGMATAATSRTARMRSTATSFACGLIGLGSVPFPGKRSPAPTGRPPSDWTARPRRDVPGVRRRCGGPQPR